MEDIYRLFAGSEPDAQQEAMAMAAALRRKRQGADGTLGLSQLASLGQNPLLSGLAQSSMGAAGQMGADVRQGQNMLGQAGQFRLQQAMAAARDRAHMDLEKQKHGNALRSAAEKKAADEKKRSDDTAEGLRKEFNQLPAVKQFEEVSVSFDKLQRAAKDPSPAGDMALIFGFMKMQDPGSSVREGEYASAQNAGSVDAKVRNAYNSILNGQRLTPEQRADFLKQGANAFGAHESRYRAQADRYRGLAGDRADDVIRVGGQKPAAVSAAGMQLGDDGSQSGLTPGEQAEWERLNKKYGGAK